MNKKVFKWIIENGKKSVIFIVLLTLGSVITSLISLQFSMESKNIIDIATGVKEGSFNTAVIRIAGFLAVLLVLQITINFINVHASSRFEIHLKNSVFKRLLNKDYLSVSKYHSGELLNRINSDVGVIVELPTAPSRDIYVNI